MAEAAAAGTSGQSSSNSGSQQSQAQGSEAQSGASQGQGQQQTNSGAQGQQQQAAATRPDWLPETYWDGDKAEIKGVDLRKSFDDLSAFKAEQDIRANTLPKAETDYQVRLPDGFKAPEGIAFEFDKDDPLLAEARKAALANKVDQKGFEQMLGIFAADKISQVQRFEAAKGAELGKLGTTAPQRIDAVCNWLTAMGGQEAQLTVDTLKKYPVAANVAMFENLIKRMSSQGGGAFSQQHREGAPEANKIPGYDKMSFEQRRGAQLSLPQRAAAGR